CDCGARFEVEDDLAAREVSCPECQARLTVPARASAPPRTSLLALASAILALVGAFTVLGTVAAVVLGGLALAEIGRAGRGGGVGRGGPSRAGSRGPGSPCSASWRASASPP